MKKFTLLFLALLFSIGASSQGDFITPANGDIKLNVLMWNILGKRNLESYFDLNGQTGRERMIEIIQETEADIVCMTETYGSAVDISNATGFYYWTPDPTANLTIFSRYPLENAGIVPGMSLYSFIRATVVLPDGRKVKVYNIWLTSEGRGINKIKDLSISDTEFNSGDDNRADQLAGLLSHSELQQDLQNQDEIPVIIAGDFNCVSHLDYTQATKAAGLNYGRILDCRASKDMASKGFTDTYRAMHPTITNQTLGHTWETWKATDELFARIDYIYSAGEKLIPETSRAIVHHKSDLTVHWPNWPSDHGAVLTTFNFRTTLDPEPPTAGFDFAKPCMVGAFSEGSEVSFSDESTGYPTTYNWVFEGGTPATSTDKNPVVTYNSSGIFDVELTVSNSVGSDVLKKADAITVEASGSSSSAFTYINFEDGVKDLSQNEFDLTADNVTISDNLKYSDSTLSYGEFNDSHIEIYQGDLSECLPKQAFTASCLVYKKSSEAYGGFIGCFQDNGSEEEGMILGNLGRKFSIGLCTQDDPTISYLTAPNDYDLNTWYHIAVTYDGSVLKMFVDGVEVLANNNEGGDVIWPTNSWYGAGWYKDNNEDFGLNGYLDEINLLSEALSSTEIKKMYNDLNALTVNVKRNLKFESLNVFVQNGVLNYDLDQSVYLASNATIFSTSGKTIMQILNPSNQINIGALSVGTYFLNVTHSNGLVSQAQFVVK